MFAESIAIASFVLVFLYLFKLYARPRSFPPGPYPLPIIGNLHLLGKEPQKSLKNLACKYGDVFSLFFGGYKVVIVNNIENAKEALIQKATDFAGRPPSITGIETAKGKATGCGIDIVYSDYGIYWRTIRKIAHQALRMYGSNRDNQERVINNHASQLIERLRARVGMPFDPKRDLCLTTTNIICTIVFGSQYDIDDEEFTEIMYYNKLMFEGLAGANGVDFMPWLRFFPNRNIQLLRESASLRDPVLERWLTKHQDSYEEGRIRDFTDALISAANDEMTENKSSRRYLERDNMIMILADVFNAAIETTATSLCWFVAYSVLWPDTQKKVHEELDRVIGRERKPCMTDRASMPYLEATINEMMRLSSVGPLGVPHKTTCDTSLAGYKIPKDTHVIFNHYAMHHDVRHWDDPETFNPERWLDKDGKFTPGTQTSFLPFSAGKRVCFGESLAKMELFLILSQVYQQFEFRTADGEEPPKLDGLVFLTHEPYPFKVVASERQ